MRGVITSKDVILHSLSIVRLWGVRTWLACLRAAISRQPTTFLGVLYPMAPCPVHSRAAAVRASSVA